MAKTIDTEVVIEKFSATSDFIANLKRTHQLIISVSMPVVGTSATFKKNIAKPMMNGDKHYVSSIIMSKGVGEDLNIEYNVKDQFGEKLISFNDKFKKLDDISGVLDYIIEKIS